MTNKDLPKYGFVSPGWPIFRFPNGIVSYIHNIKQGFTDIADIAVLSTIVETEESEDNIYKIELSENLTQKMQRKLLSLLPYSFVKTQNYNQTWKNIANSIGDTLKTIPYELSIIEVEDTFGIAKWLKPMIDTPIVTRLHGPFCVHGFLQKEIQGAEYQYRLKAEGEALKMSDGITSPSKDVLDKVREFYGLPLENAVVIPNPVLPVADKNLWCPLFDDPSVLFVGRFDFHKGGDLVISAFNDVATLNKEVTLNFIGPDIGIDIDNEHLNFWEYTKKVIKDENILRRVHYHGQKKPDEIAGYRKTSTVTVMASRYENFSLALLEALSAGCPVVATNVGGNPEIIRNNENGVLVSSDSSQSIAAAIIDLLNDTDKLKQLSENAIHDTLLRFHPEMVARQTNDYFEQLITKAV